MTLAEIVSTAISLLALTISGITAYRTFFARFRSEIYVRPRIFLSRVNRSPCIVIGCEISNQGACPGSIDDIVMRVKFRQHSTSQGTTKSINTYTFLPTLVRDEYSLFKPYQESDFEPFQSVALSANARLTKYIVFSPSNEAGFSPSAGEIELQFFSRNSREPNWRKVNAQLRIPIDESASAIWGDPDGKSVMLEVVEHNRLRESLMEKISG